MEIPNELQKTDLSEIIDELIYNEQAFKQHTKYNLWIDGKKKDAQIEFLKNKF